MRLRKGVAPLGRKVCLDNLIGKNIEGGSFFMSRRTNVWGAFIRLCEWRLKERDRFIIVPAGENCVGWEGL